jgi:hypothetical protein
MKSNMINLNAGKQEYYPNSKISLEEHQSKLRDNDLKMTRFFRFCINIRIIS